MKPFPRFRFSLLTLLLFVIAISSGIALWFRWEPWGVAYRIENAPRVLCFSEDSRLLVVQSTDPNVRARVIDAATGSDRFVLAGRNSPLYSAAFSADGQWLATSGDNRDFSFRIWDIETGKTIHVLAGLPEGIYCQAFTPDKQTLVTSSCDDTVRAWEIDTHKQKFKLSFGALAFTDANLSKDGRRLLFCENRTVTALDLQTGTVREGGSMQSDVEDVQVLSNGKLAAVLANNTVYFCDPETLKLDSKPAIDLPLSQEILQCSRDSLITVDKSHNVFVWDLTNSTLKGSCAGANPDDTERDDVRISPNGDHVYRAEAAIIWNVASDSSQHLDGQVIEQFSPDDSRVFTTENKSSSLTCWSRRRPEGRWGVLALPELWLAIIASALLLVRLARRVFARKALQR